MDFLKKVYKKSDFIVSRRIADERILVPISKDAGDLDNIYTLNETAAIIWELIDGKTKVKELKERIVEGFEVTDEEAEEDITAYIQQMENIRAIVEEEAYGVP